MLRSLPPESVQALTQSRDFSQTDIRRVPSMFAKVQGGKGQWGLLVLAEQDSIPLLLITTSPFLIMVGASPTLCEMGQHCHGSVLSPLSRDTACAPCVTQQPLQTDSEAWAGEGRERKHAGLLCLAFAKTNHPSLFSGIPSPGGYHGVSVADHPGTLLCRPVTQDPKHLVSSPSSYLPSRSWASNPKSPR